MALLAQAGAHECGVAACDGGLKLGDGLGFGELIFGQAGQEQAIVCGIGHAGGAEKDQPVAGMLAIERAGDGMGEASGIEQVIHGTNGAGEGGDLSVVGEYLGACGVKVDHNDQTGAATMLSQEGGVL